MKIESNVQSDNISATEEREGEKAFKKRLRLNKETIRELKDSDLRRVAGAGLSGDSNCPFAGCDTSDIRLKTNIRDIDNALEIVLSLKGLKYEWKKDAESGLPLSEGAPLGFIAQEVEEVLPEVVTTKSNGYKAIFYQNITAVLVEGMKEQQKIIDQQKAELSEQRAELEQIKALVQKLAALAQPKVQVAGQF